MKATTTPVPDARPCEYDRSRTYGWNGENRLISAENGDTRLEFNYDYMGRRFEKKVYTANVLTKHEKFVYDGYKLIQVLDALNSDAVTMTFVWHPESTGLDTPFSMTYDGETYYYVTDGNKNVMSLIDAAGTKVAEYVYDPFGRLLSSTGSLAEINPFRFSSEYHDDETGLVYYNYRYYSPEFGRWISRDPIEEEGGVNLYAMVGNNPVNYWDKLGEGYTWSDYLDIHWSLFKAFWGMGDISVPTNDFFSCVANCIGDKGLLESLLGQTYHVTGAWFMNNGIPKSWLGVKYPPNASPTAWQPAKIFSGNWRTMTHAQRLARKALFKALGKAMVLAEGGFYTQRIGCCIYKCQKQYDIF